MVSGIGLHARGNPPDAHKRDIPSIGAIQEFTELMILRLIFLVLLLQRGVQASQPIPINVINLERDNARLAAQVKQYNRKGYR